MGGGDVREGVMERGGGLLGEGTDREGEWSRKLGVTRGTHAGG
jgi:hypothetical protein